MYNNKNRTQGGQGSRRTYGSSFATAPYNFIPYEAGRLTPCAKDDAVFSGVITCTLKALTPLMIGGSTRKTAKGQPVDKPFFAVDGKPVIPGTSLKGMLRSFVEILSNSHMSLVGRKRMYWRDVASREGTPYKQFFNDEPQAKSRVTREHILTSSGGFLKKRGAEYMLYPARVTRSNDKNAYQTGHIPKKKLGYLFRPEPNARPLEVPAPVMAWFMGQMTDGQRERWDVEAEKLGGEGARVFYAQDGNGNVSGLGTARYFRIPYAKTVAGVVGECPVNDFAATLFGRVGKDAQGNDITRKGKLAISPAVFTSASGMPMVRALLAEPHPSCLLHYLRQTRANPQGNRKRYLLHDFNASQVLLRGRKYYWHRDPEPSNPDAKGEMASDLHPLAAGAEATFDIHLDRVNRIELGAILEALTLPVGHAHKLGMGKSIGFGSVRIDVARVAVSEQGQRYASLKARFSAMPDPLMDKAAQDAVRAAFRSHVCRGKGEQFEQLPSIRALRYMTDYAQRPVQAATKTMPLEEKDGSPNFAGSKALLAEYSQVPKRVRP